MRTKNYKKQNFLHRFYYACSRGICVIAIMTTILPGIRGQAARTGKSSAIDSKAQPESPSLIVVPNGMAVVTGTGADGPTLRVVDISQFGSLWIPANFAPNYIASPAQMPLMNSWTISQFNDGGGGQAVRGLAISSDGTKIYVGSTAYEGVNKTPNIWIIGPTSTTPVNLATLPSYTATASNRRGIAGLDLDEVHNAVFASNYADGIIYRRDAATGANLGSFDPLGAYAGGSTNAFPPLGERVVAVAYNKVENRVYYGIWGSGANTVRSVGLTASGAFDPPTDRLEFTVTGSSGPVADIEFNNAGTKMLLAEENLSESGGTIFLGAHSARALEYIGGSGTWSIDPTVYPGSSRKYNTGAWFTQTNCRGGVAWAYSGITGSGIISGNEDFVMFTGDALRLDSAAVYGLQYTPSTGGAAAGAGVTANSLIADLDYDVVGQDKSNYGDVDIRRSLYTTSASADISGRVTRADGTGISKATVNLTDNMGGTRTVMTNPFGFYRFADLPTGETYFLSVSSKSYSFNTLILTLVDEETGVDFIALE